jgi:uncharacterized damage-inducible protein DinB
MQIAEMFKMELQQESGATRKTLERVPDKEWATWKPNEKSMTLQRLATHLAEIPGWIAMVIEKDELTFNTGEFKPVVVQNSAELLDLFDRNIAEGLRVLEDRPDEEFLRTWTMKVDGKTFLSLPKNAVIRSWVLNHIVHHRAQLGVYLRLLGIAVPSVYGPSADES